MILYEYEGKQLLQQAGVCVPQSQLLTSAIQPLNVKSPLVLKAQVLSGKRADVGGIVIVESESEFPSAFEKMFGSVINKEKVSKILVEEKIDLKSQYYFSLSYDTDYRSLVANFSLSGGTGIEDRGAQTLALDILNTHQFPDQLTSVFPQELLEKLIKLFLEQDCTLLEINPLVQSAQGDWVALDAKIKLDDAASIRHPEWSFEPRGVPGYTPTQNEIEAKKIDEQDYRGTAGSAYFDIEGGDIAILSSGGGVSLTAMDAMIGFGGKPANFTEYSGNPPKEKVAKLTKIVLNKPNIHGLWVIGTVAANFTDIFETMTGFIEGLRQAQSELGQKFDFPIVIRRGGPREDEAFEMLRQVKDFDLHLQGEEVSIEQSAKIMTDLASKYAITTVKR